MTAGELVLIALLLLIVANGLVSFWTGFARGIRKHREMNALEHIAPFAHLEPFAPTQQNIVRGLSALLSVREVIVTESKGKSWVRVDIRLCWWAVLGLGYFHRRAKMEVEMMLWQVLPAQVAWEIGEVTVFRLPEKR